MSEAEEAFREAAAVGNLAAARVYITNGININAQNRMNGWTALHWACSRGRKDMAQLLLMNGASVVITSSSGQTPIDVAKGAALTLFDQPSGSNQADSEAPTASVTAAKADESLDQDEDASEPATFVPAYLRYPDLSKVWTVPGSGDLGLEKPSQEANAAAAAVDSKPDDAMKQATPIQIATEPTPIVIMATITIVIMNMAIARTPVAIVATLKMPYLPLPMMINTKFWFITLVEALQRY
eukprot:jgi/Hompol1/6960/HPOL_001014-RA